MAKIVYELGCHCGEPMRVTALDLSNPQPDGSILIDVKSAVGQTEWTSAVGQTEWTCEECGCTTYTGDIPVEVEPDDCPGTGDEDSDEGDDE